MRLIFSIPVSLEFLVITVFLSDTPLSPETPQLDPGSFLPPFLKFLPLQVQTHAIIIPIVVCRCSLLIQTIKL